MVPAVFANFFLGSVGASAALIGLLFVSIAIAPERIFGPSATARRRTAAGSAFTALLNAFFVSLAALIPTSNLGYTALIMAIIGLVNTLAMGRHTWEDRRPGRGLLAYALLPGSLIVYTLQIWYAAQLLRDARDTDALYGLVYLLLPAYSLGLARAWELLGGGNDGLRSLLGLGVGVVEHPTGDAGEGEHTDEAGTDMLTRARAQQLAIRAGNNRVSRTPTWCDIAARPCRGARSSTKMASPAARITMRSWRPELGALAHTEDRVQ